MGGRREEERGGPYNEDGVADRAGNEGGSGSWIDQIKVEFGNEDRVEEGEDEKGLGQQLKQAGRIVKGEHCDRKQKI